MSDKTGSEGRGYHIRGSGWAKRTRCRALAGSPKKKWCAGIAGKVYDVGLVAAKTEIPGDMDSNNNRLDVRDRLLFLLDKSGG